MKQEHLIEFRKIYTALFGNKKKIVITQEIQKNPLYARYKTLAPEFYEMMLRNRRKFGQKV